MRHQVLPGSRFLFDDITRSELLCEVVDVPLFGCRPQKFTVEVTNVFAELVRAVAPRIDRHENDLQVFGVFPGFIFQQAPECVEFMQRIGADVGTGKIAEEYEAPFTLQAFLVEWSLAVIDEFEWRQ